MSTMEFFLAVLTPVCSIAFFLMGQYSARRKEFVHSPDTWKLEIQIYSNKDEVAANGLLSDYTPDMYELVINRLEAETPPACTLSSVDGIDTLSSDRVYKYMIVRNNSPNSLSLTDFEKDDMKMCVRRIIMPNKSVLIALPTYGQPEKMWINYNGTHLLYSILSNEGFLRPIKYI